MKNVLPALAVTLALSTAVAFGQSSFQAILSGANENPVNASPGTGLGTLILSADQSTITVNESWSGLTANATLSHIHGPAAPGVNAGVLFPFSGVPSATSGSIPQQSFAINATQVGYLMSGLLYFNVHTGNFPGGEIRGQIVPVPEPGALALLGLGLAAIGWKLRRRA